MFFVLALALVIEDMIKHVADVVRGIQVVGGYLAGALDSIARAISSTAGAIESGIDHIVGGTWHLLASYLDRTWNQLEAHSSVIQHLAELVGRGLYSITGLRSLVHAAVRTIHGIEHGVKTLERDFKGIEHDVRTIERSIAHGIGNDVLPRIRSLERSLAHVETKVIPAVEGAETALQNDLTQLGEYIRSNFLSSATDAVTAAVAVALSALGLGGLRCSNLLSSLSNRGCGLWSGLEDLLGLFIDAVILTDLCAILPDAVTAFGLVEGELTGLISQAADAVCAQPPAGWVELSVAPSQTPPPQAFDPATL